MPRSSSAAVKIRIRVTCGDEDAFRPGKAQLLESLLETGSLNSASSAMKMSYMKARALVRAMNAHFIAPLVVMTRGGKQGGGTQVTDTGRKMLAEYHTMCEASEAAGLPSWHRLRKLLKD